ncbi:MAG: hemolysin III family protein [Planctomycetes bacterium]|nr:hemolysin III family protein [Planctomycetota bacterium]
MYDIYSLPGFSEPFSCWSHLVGAVVFAALAPGLLRRGRHVPGRRIYLGVFVLTAVFLLSMSGTYHLLPRGTGGKAVLLRLDFAAIYALIAGTFTAIHGAVFAGVWRWGMIGLVWTIAAASITLKTIYFSEHARSFWLMLYLMLGWIGAISTVALYRRYGYSFVRLIIWGGIAYSVGAIMNVARQPTLIPGIIGPHEVYHVLVLVALGLHWRFVWSIAGWPHSAELELSTQPAILEPTEIERAADAALDHTDELQRQLAEYRSRLEAADREIARLRSELAALRSDGGND